MVWGAVVMIATGLLLWANNLALKFLPKIWLDVATSVHFYEALLATPGDRGLAFLLRNLRPGRLSLEYGVP